MFGTQELCRHEFESPNSVLVSVSDFQSTLLTPCRLKPATLRAWGVVSDLISWELCSEVNGKSMQVREDILDYK